MKIRTDDNWSVLYRNGEPVAAWDREECVLEMEAGLGMEDLKGIIQELMSLLHEYLSADVMPLPENPANIPYIRN